jgi:hypothetical protein
MKIHSYLVAFFFYMKLSEEHPLVQEWGGKHGGLMVLADAGFGDNIVPAEFLRATEELSSHARKRIKAACTKFDVVELVVRTSHVGDYAGLTDAMPTEFCDSESLPATLDLVRKRLNDPCLARFALNEGTSFSPDEATISIAPSLRECSPIAEGTITEHPNENGLVFIDYRDAETGLYQPHAYQDGKEVELSWESFSDDFTKAGNDLYCRLHRSGISEESQAMQFEYGIDPRNGRNFLYQARFFAPRSITTNSYNGTQGRFFGNISGHQGESAPSTNELPLLMVTHTPGTLLLGREPKVLTWQKFEREHPTEPYLLIKTDISEDKDSRLTLEDQPMNLRAYVGRGVAINHGHTRFLQYALKSGGAGWLTTNDCILYNHDLRRLQELVGTRVLIHRACATSIGYISEY